MKALIAMSGGVDSSVSALLMKKRGYDCIGCTMKLYTKDSGCCSIDDVEDARAVCSSLDIPYYVFNYTDAFKKNVIDNFIECYERGETPNPCIECNRHLKFGGLLQRARELSCDKVVTGHYARIRETSEGYELLKAADLSKDQSYVLYSLNQEQLSMLYFPLGELNKSDTRELAGENGFINADKPDSQDICFVPDGDYAAVIRQYSDKEYKTGDFVDFDGKVLGQHKGIINYTIGQRRGLGIPAADRLYVCKIDVENNRVVLGSNEQLFSDTVFVKNVNWISGHEPLSDIRCSAKIRYRHQDKPCTLQVLGDNRVKIIFDEPQRAATPGQSAVFYDGDKVLGGGIITGDIWKQ